MKTKDKLKLIMEGDLELTKVSLITLEKEKDPNHYDRRKQQRAISEEMIQICYHYGSRRWIHGALTFTLTDRSLRNTPYKDLANELRGLRIVCVEKSREGLQILTTYWCDEITKSNLRLRASL